MHSFSAIKKNSKTLDLKKIKYLIIIIGSLIISSKAFGTRPIWHGLIGCSYIFETHFDKNLHGFEINLNRHYSSCISSTYLNSFGINYLFNNDYKEVGLSYSSQIFRKISGGGHGGWNLIFKINPSVVNDNNNKTFVIKPGIGATIYSGARTSFATFQVFALYNYNVYFQKEQNIIGMNNHSIQIGFFIGINSFEMRPRKHRENLDNKTEE